MPEGMPEDLDLVYSIFVIQGKSLFPEARLGGRVLWRLEMVNILREVDKDSLCCQGGSSGRQAPRTGLWPVQA